MSAPSKGPVTMKRASKSYDSESKTMTARRPTMN